MPQNVEINVKTQLNKIVKDLEGITASFDDAQESLKKTANQVDDSVTNEMDNAKNRLQGIGQVMAKVLKGIRDDFKALGSLGALAGSLKISNTMRGSISDTVKLSDAVRKLSGVFKIATADQSRFVGDLTKGLGDVGLGSEAAANALQGLSETQVRGQETLTNYAKTAGMLASASGQKGQEGQIAQGLAGVVQARGGNVNDTKQMQAVAEAVSRAHEATGANATDILSNMQELFTSMNDNFKKAISPKAAAQLTAITAAGGKGGTQFIKDYLSTNSQLRAGLDVMGFGKLFTGAGLNANALKGIIGEGKRLGLHGDVVSGLTNMGLSEDQAKGLKMLYDQLDAVNKAAGEVANSTRTVAQSFEDAKTLGEAFGGNMDKVKSIFAKPVAAGTGGLTDLLKGSQKSTGGSLAVVGGSALLAGVLAKVGLGGIGSAMGIKGIQERALESQGEKVIPVRVVNASEIGGGGLGGIVKGGLGLPAAAGGAALTAGLAGGAALGNLVSSGMKGTAIDKSLTDAVMKISQALGLIPQTVGARAGSVQRMDVRVKLEDRNKELKTTHSSGKGPNQGVH